MNIAVCVSHVPDTAAKVSIGDDGKSINKDGVTFVVNPYDEFAIEEALATRDKLGDSTVTIVSVGSENNKDSIRKALAMGADSAVLLRDDNPRDSMSVAKALADELKNINAELVFFGKQSVDYDNSITGQLTAELLNYNCISVVVKLDIENSKVTAEREIEGGKEVVESSLPIVITCQKGLNEPRYASLKGIMAAKKKTIEEKPAAESQNLTEVIAMKKPPMKEPGKIIGEDASAVQELIRLLNEEAKVI